MSEFSERNLLEYSVQKPSYFVTLGRILQSLLYGLQPGDPLTSASVGIVLVGVALAACWIPASGAMRVDPT